MPAGIAVIDAPDIDSIEPGNRALAEELFAEADLWLFVTTASRYADAANWRHLRAARERRVALAVVLDRVAAGHAQGIVDHMRDLLGPPEPPLFLIPEATLDRQGMLPDSITAPLRGWLADVVEAARTGPPQPAIGVAHVPHENIATPADLVPTDAASTQDSAASAEPVTGSFSAFGGDAGLTVELELTPGPQAAPEPYSTPEPTTYGHPRTPPAESQPEPEAAPAANDPYWPDVPTSQSPDPYWPGVEAPVTEPQAEAPEVFVPSWSAFAAFGTPPPPEQPPPAPQAPAAPQAAWAEEGEPAEGPATPDNTESPHRPETENPEDDTSAADPVEAAAEAPDAAEKPDDADRDEGVVESDPPDGRPADIPKAADVGETVKL